MDVLKAQKDIFQMVYIIWEMNNSPISAKYHITTYSHRNARINGGELCESYTDENVECLSFVIIVDTASTGNTVRPCVDMMWWI